MLLEAGRAEDEAEALGQVERVEHLAHLAPLLLVLDLAGDADAVHVGHHHDQPAGDGEVARERRPLRADALLEHLHQHLVAALAARSGSAGAARRGIFLPTLLGSIATREVLRVQIGDVQEAVLSLAVVDERGLDGRLDVDHPTLVDVADVGRGRRCARCRALRGDSSRESRPGTPRRVNRSRPSARSLRSGSIRLWGPQVMVLHGQPGEPTREDRHASFYTGNRGPSACPSQARFRMKAERSTNGSGSSVARAVLDRPPSGPRRPLGGRVHVGARPVSRSVFPGAASWNRPWEQLQGTHAADHPPPASGTTFIQRIAQAVDHLAL